MASGEGKRDAAGAPANDSIDELLDGLPADAMLPRKRARSIEEVKAAAPISQNRRVEDKVVVSNDSDPRERAKRQADQAKREHSTFGTAFLQARATREKMAFGVVMMLAVLGIYAFIRHIAHSDGGEKMATTTSTQSVQSAHILATAASSPTSADDIPPPPSTVEAPGETATATPSHVPPKASHSGEAHAPRPPPSASGAGTRTDVSRSL